MDAAAEQRLDEVFGELYEKIKRLAARVRWQGKNPTLNPTALAHEAYVKLRENPPDLSTKNYDEVIRIFARAMREILIDAARRKGALKRSAATPTPETALPVEDAMTLNLALDELEKEDERRARVVECRYLLGMTTEETAAATGHSVSTVEREWREAREWLGRRIYGERN